MSWSVAWQVVINGTDRTAGMSSYLMDISVVDKAGATSDSCSLTFDDTAGQLRLPQNDEDIVIRLAGVKVFEGIVSSVRSKGSRSAGRVLTVSGKGVDTRGKAKQGQQFHMDDATLGDFMKTSAEKAGFSIDVHKDLASIKRSYWGNDRQSFLHLGERMAREFGATFKVRGKKAVLAPRGSDIGLPMITGVVGSNLIDWDIEPDSGRGRFSGGSIDYHDRSTGKIETLKSDYDEGASKAEAAEVGRTLAANKDEAQQKLDGRKQTSNRSGGKGSATIDIAPNAQAEGLFLLSGARAGVDGTYKMTSVTHKASRSGGATTSLQLEQPQGGAGVDGR
ncbi:late control D family protein [uncultured Cohaesibacter sp.]|uniref:phage late control D family protein n=1 Tax=uncultured Cohaesibacter sp. TaxID=1002546 RepID=UPI0029C901ED|nr:late control D family protein [uncultured Cohaesibacter sp.]